GGGAIAGALSPASVTRGLDWTLGLPCRTRLATALPADRETSGACSHGQPYRIVRMNVRTYCQDRPCVAVLRRRSEGRWRRQESLEMWEFIDGERNRTAGTTVSSVMIKCSV